MGLPRNTGNYISIDGKEYDMTKQKIDVDPVTKQRSFMANGNKTFLPNRVTTSGLAQSVVNKGIGAVKGMVSNTVKAAGNTTVKSIGDNIAKQGVSAITGAATNAVKSVGTDLAKGLEGSLLSGFGGASSIANPITAGIGAALGVVGAIGSFTTKRPNVDTRVGSYLDSNLTNKANQYTDLGSDYYKLGEEQLRRTMMDAAPTSSSLLALAGATGGSASQANLQRRASESKVGEGVRTGLLGMYQAGATTGLEYNKLNYNQAGTSMQSTMENEWNKFNAKQQAWSNISSAGGSLMGLGFSGSSNKPKKLGSIGYDPNEIAGEEDSNDPSYNTNYG